MDSQNPNWGHMSARVPGITAVHAIVTPECRKNRTPLGALAEAIARLQAEYVACLENPQNAEVSYHFVLTVEHKDAAWER